MHPRRCVGVCSILGVPPRWDTSTGSRLSLMPVPSKIAQECPQVTSNTRAPFSPPTLPSVPSRAVTRSFLISLTPLPASMGRVEHAHEPSGSLHSTLLQHLELQVAQMHQLITFVVLLVESSQLRGQQPLHQPEAVFVGRVHDVMMYFIGQQAQGRQPCSAAQGGTNFSIWACHKTGAQPCQPHCEGDRVHGMNAQTPSLQSVSYLLSGKTSVRFTPCFTRPAPTSMPM